MDIEKFMRMIDYSVNVVEGNNVNDLANLTKCNCKVS